jgi:hypothetical protein
MSSYTTKDNTKEVLSALDKAIERGLEAIGLNAERHAKKDPNMPVDTGLARNSIAHAVSGKEASISEYKADKGDGKGSYSGTAPNDKEKAVYLGSNVEYFGVIELGGRNMTARHVLQNAATQHKDEYQKLMKENMENA